MTSTTRKPAGGVLAGVLAAGAVLAILAGAPTARGDDEPAAGYSPFAGRQTYKTYCMNCHGVEGRGDGYLAESLKQVPSDLTLLSEKNGGSFPAERVAAVVDGREAVRLHGTREMPIWGDALLWPEEESPERRAHVQRKLGELVAFVESIQKSATEAEAP